MRVKLGAWGDIDAPDALNVDVEEIIGNPRYVGATFENDITCVLCTRVSPTAHVFCFNTHRKHVNKMGDSLRRLEADLRDTHETMLWLRRREAEMRDLNEATNTRVTWLSIMTLIVCVGLCVWQVVFLNQFFQRKKLL